MTQSNILTEIANEVARQKVLWGEQNHPNGTGMNGDTGRADAARHTADVLAEGGSLSWRDILWEEVAEALAEHSPSRLRAELVQVAAVVASWIDSIDRGEQRECARECDTGHTQRNFNCVVWRQRMGLV